MATISFSLPVFTIPLYYMLALYPHASAGLSIYTQRLYDNRNPKGTEQQATLNQKLSPRDLAAYERAESCHRNHMENMPLFVAAVFAGLLAEQRVGEGEIGLGAYCVGWMVLRVLYTANYMMAETRAWSLVRSVLYLSGCLWSFVTLWRAAFVLGN
jgi:uncharacterized MAPEG superfamily protein